MAYVYAGLITIAVTAMVVLVPIWQRGGREALVESSRWTIPLFLGLAACFVLLGVLLQRPARESVVVILATTSSVFAGFVLSRGGDQPAWRRVTLSVVIVLGLAITLVVLAGGLR